MHSVAKRTIVRCMFLIACVVYLAMQPTSAAIVASRGTVTGWGDNNYGQLGNGTTISSASPVAVAFPAGTFVTSIAAGFFHNIALALDGAYEWGWGVAGGATTSPTKIVFPPPVTAVWAITAGGFHNLALTDAGLFAWGTNASGQLGDGTTVDRATPVKVVFPSTVTNIRIIAAGAYHSLALTDDGLYAWGANGDGQLGDGTRLDRVTPVKVALPPWNVVVTAIAGGGAHSVAATDDGIYTWGSNMFGQLGDGTLADSSVPVLIGYFDPPVVDFIDVAAGFYHTVVATRSWNATVAHDDVFAFGYNGFGQLGDGTTVDRHTAVKSALSKKVTTIASVSAGDSFTIAATDDGVYGWGSNAAGQLAASPTPRPQLAPARIKAESNVIEVGAGYYHSLALH